MRKTYLCEINFFISFLNSQPDTSFKQEVNNVLDALTPIAPKQNTSNLNISPQALLTVEGIVDEINVVNMVRIGMGVV